MGTDPLGYKENEQLMQRPEVQFPWGKGTHDAWWLSINPGRDVDRFWCCSAGWQGCRSGTSAKRKRASKSSLALDDILFSGPYPAGYEKVERLDAWGHDTLCLL